MRLSRRLPLWLSLSSALALGGCANLGYYWHAIGGHMEIMAKRRPIAELLAEPGLDPVRRAQLEAVGEIRAFASRELALPDNASYRSYVDLGRPYALWNVFATPELSLTPRQWCFLIAGCVAYRGYFEEAAARRFAAELAAEGLDVYVGGVAAYSTLGWFDDPVLNTILARPLVEVAGIIFHELAHQRLYLADDSAFSESFATAVQLEGVRRWLARRAATPEYADYQTRIERRGQFVTLVMRHRARLEAAYGAAPDDEAKRAAKRTILAELRADYRHLKAGWGGYGGYDAWFADNLNNAKLVAVGTYERHVAAFAALIVQSGGDMAAFYREAERLAALPRTQREAALERLAHPAAQTRRAWERSAESRSAPLPR